jgi:hypothetical protein
MQRREDEMRTKTYPEEQLALATASGEEQVVQAETPPQVFLPGDQMFRGLALTSLRAAMERIPYLEMTHAKSDGTLSAMITMRLRLRKTHVPIEAIKADIRNVWRQTTLVSPQSVVKFVDTTSVFEFRFAHIHEGGTFVTGAVMVELPRELVYSGVLNGAPGDLRTL